MKQALSSTMATSCHSAITSSCLLSASRSFDVLTRIIRISSSTSMSMSTMSASRRSDVAGEVPVVITALALLLTLSPSNLQ